MPPPSLSAEPACPLCGKPAVPGQAPFCSRGCKDRDLLNWLGGAYAVPGEPLEETDLSED